MTMGGMIFCTTATPMLPPGRVEAQRPALVLLRVEERDVGHRRGEVAATEAGGRGDRPAAAANGMWGWLTAQASNRQGISSSAAEMVVQLRPPKTGTAKVYGSRRKAPTPLGTATRHRAWLAVSAQPDAAGCAGCPEAPTAVIWTTTMLHNIHTLNPTCSAKIENIRLRRAIGLARRLPERRDLRAASRRSSAVPA